MRFLAQIFSDLVQAVGTAGDQHQLMPAPRKLQRDGLANS
jgi:hypothetical protein